MESALATASSWVFAQLGSATELPPPLLEKLGTSSALLGLVASSTPLVLLVARQVFVPTIGPARNSSQLFLCGGSLSAVVGTLLAGPLQWLFTVFVLGIAWRWPLTTLLFGLFWSTLVWLWWNHQQQQHHHQRNTAQSTTETATTTIVDWWVNPRTDDANDDKSGNDPMSTLEWQLPEWLPPHRLLFLAMTFSWIVSAMVADALHASWKSIQRSLRRTICCGLQTMLWDGPRYVLRGLFAIPIATVTLLLWGRKVPTDDEDEDDDDDDELSSDANVRIQEEEEKDDDDDHDDNDHSSIGGSHIIHEHYNEWDDESSNDEDYVYMETPDCEFDLDEYEAEEYDNNLVLSHRKSERLWQRGL